MGSRQRSGLFNCVFIGIHSTSPNLHCGVESQTGQQARMTAARIAVPGQNRNRQAGQGCNLVCAIQSWSRFAVRLLRAVSFQPVAQL